jgi:hypothetical protein
MAINYFEFFALVQKKALSVMANTKSSKEHVAAALDIITKITTSMGRCLEVVTRQQTFILTSATVARRESVLHQHKMPTEASDWLRAQPFLTGTALFGPVAGRVKPLLAEHLARKTQEKFISSGSSRKESGTSSKQQQQRPNSRHASDRGRPASSASSATSRPRQESKPKPNFQRQDSYSSKRGGRSQKGKQPFHKGGAQGYSKK